MKKDYSDGFMAFLFVFLMVAGLGFLAAVAVSICSR